MGEQLFAITFNVGPSFTNEMGSWRMGRPVYANSLSPCNKARPAGENIQQRLYHAEEGDYQAVRREIVVNSLTPAMTGRVCYHPCQSTCNYVQTNETVGINVIERFLGDEVIEQGWHVPVLAPGLGKFAFIAGAGPPGSLAAYHLRLAGHRIHTKGVGPMAGGMMRFGIPLYRLSRGVLDTEIRRIKEMGAFIEYNAKVENVEDELGKWDAVFLAAGVYIGRHTGAPAGELAKTVDIISLLQGVEKDESLMFGRRVVVRGGGNTAIDMARTAKCLDVLKAITVYRRTRDRIPAHDSEVTEVKEEGIVMCRLSTVKHANGGALTIEKMELDDSGFPQPAGEFEELSTDSLIMVLGQETDLSLTENASGIEIEDRVVKVNGQMVTGVEGVFTSGNMVSSERTVTVTISHGKKTLRHTDACLYGTTYTPALEHADAGFSRMTLWYYANALRQVRTKLKGARHASTSDEAVQGLDEGLVLLEVRHYMSCDNCPGCDNCFGVCPDNVIVKIIPGKYESKHDYYRGYGLYVEECFCGAISMVPEQV